MDIVAKVIKKKVVAYIRVSTDAQAGDDKFGIEVQRQIIMKYCEEHGYEIIRWVSDEGFSGKDERPGFDGIINGEISNPPFEAVIVAKSDRVARNLNLYYYYKTTLKIKKQIDLISVSEDFGEMGQFAPIIESFTAFMAEMELGLIKSRTSGGRKVKAAGGGYAGGRAPYGYSILNHQYAIEPNEALAVKIIFALHSDGFSLQKISDDLAKKGFMARSGKPFSPTTLKSILDNKKTYQGYYRYGDMQGWVKGLHSPIIDDDEVIK